MWKIAINGLGRIGRAALKIILDTPGLTVVAVNDLAPLENLAYLLRYNTVYGRYEKPVENRPERLVATGQSIRVLQQKDPASPGASCRLNWFWNAPAASPGARISKNICRLGPGARFCRRRWEVRRW